MAVYFAFALLVAHIALGALQFEKHPLYFTALLGAVLLISTLHLFTGFALNAQSDTDDLDGWLIVSATMDIEDSHAKILRPATGEAIAVFRNGNSIIAVSNVCRHQGGPLGEGRIVDGCITCPWHGFQYRPEDGCSPPPFTEKIATFRTKIIDGIVYVDPRPSPAGTTQIPSLIEAAT